LVVERDGLIEDVPNAALFDIGRQAQHQPQRIVVEVAADGVVATLGQRLILMISAASFQLGGGDVEGLAPAPVQAALRSRLAELGPDGAGAVPIRTSRD